MKAPYEIHTCTATMVAFLLVSTGSCSRSAEPGEGESAPAQAKGGETYDFEDGTAGQTPPHFTAALLGGGGPIQWVIQTADDAPSGEKVVAQLSDDETNVRYPHLVRDDFSARDVDLSVQFKTSSGKVDASGGLIFRYQDKDNFYVVRANALEGNVVAYKTEDGKRRNIGVKGKGNAYGVKANVPHLKWNTLRVIAKGNLFSIYLNGKKVFDVENDTFTGAGAIGLWTKADAVTQFDDLTAASLDDR